MTPLIVGLGGALGAMARYGVNIFATKMFGVNFPYGTLGINIAGSLLMGLLIGLFAVKEPNGDMKLFLTTGILGGFTTFSAFSLETIMLWDRKPLAAIAYVAASVALSLLACWLGLKIMRGTA
jgi:fluoride exporter